jgi:hypothetical protein
MNIEQSSCGARIFGQGGLSSLQFTCDAAASTEWLSDICFLSCKADIGARNGVTFSIPTSPRSQIYFSSPPPNHPLRRFTLWSDTVELTSTDIDIILANTPNVEYFNLQTISCMAFVDLAVGFVNQLNRLSRFDCYITENMNKETRIADVTTIHQFHPCFRIFATKQIINKIYENEIKKTDCLLSLYT